MKNIKIMNLISKKYHQKAQLNRQNMQQKKEIPNFQAFRKKSVHFLINPLHKNSSINIKEEWACQQRQ